MNGRSCEDNVTCKLLNVWRQFQVCKPHAVQIAGRFAKSPQKDFLRWTESVRKAKANGQEISLLQTLVSAGLASVGASTANNERDFAAVRKRTNPSVAEIERYLQMFMEALKDDTSATNKKTALCQEARQVWRKGFGAPRRSGEKRLRNWKNGRLRQKNKKAKAG